eukprot:CAMPEP_0197878044 /NCGR_PEP_ID=MMETSP1439-20131203/6541_1 /TAXON_ID=66791 /ORGANISM="Gonyaulax spinifera, Strain CCMP409" /LENGTH=521 /DNA_ID=CAMNT_0043497423 /DNA_START=131 /DNA_END=1696 /DNA_ORIENTATION=-
MPVRSQRVMDLPHVSWDGPASFTSSRSGANGATRRCNEPRSDEPRAGELEGSPSFLTRREWLPQKMSYEASSGHVTDEGETEPGGSFRRSSGRADQQRIADEKEPLSFTMPVRRDCMNELPDMTNMGSSTASSTRTSFIHSHRSLRPAPNAQDLQGALLAYRGREDKSFCEGNGADSAREDSQDEQDGWDRDSLCSFGTLSVRDTDIRVLSEDSNDGPSWQSRPRSTRPSNIGRSVAMMPGVEKVAMLPRVQRVDERLGSGAFGNVQVYRCRMEGYNEQVVLKLYPENIEHDPEADILQTLRHPNIVGLLEVNLDQKFWVVFEDCPGGGFQELIHCDKKAFNNIGPMQRVQAVHDVALAVQYLHSQGVIHRDLKSSHCYLKEKMIPGMPKLPTIKVGGMSVARKVERAEVCHLTAGIGTVRYMAPEVFESNTYGHSADIYSFGILAHEILSGQRPYHDCRKNEAVLAISIMRGLRPSLSQLEVSTIGKLMARLMEKSWRTDPDERPTASELTLQLAEILAE